MKILLDEVMYQRNISIRQLQILSGVPRSSIEDIMSGRSMPRMDTMEKLAKALKCRISDLYESDFK